jgi:cell wall-associated NlpC family hydrolase
MPNNRTLQPALRLFWRAALAGIIAFSAILFAPSATPSAHAATVRGRTVRVHRAFRIVRSKLGDPYRYGAEGPRAFDCSGLTFFSFHREGFRGLPRTAASQSHFVRHIRRSHMRRGDFIFFHSGGGAVYHVGIFAGWHNRHRWMIDAPHTGTRVRRERIWTNNWTAGTLR